ncbi:MAG: class II aldolase/adducin family protein [Betaproteobacteria bacterium]
MDLSNELRIARPAAIDDEEWRLRLELAACYRLFDFLGWTELIFNHITVRVPGDPGGAAEYLINPYGLNYSEVTASNLVKIDVAGNKRDQSPHPVNIAGFVIHSAVHAARPDAHCVIHTHTTAGLAVACKTGGLRHDNFYSAILAGNVGYHDFEGVTTGLDEQPRLVASLGNRDVLILRNHGLLVVGPHIPAAFSTMWTLQRACEVQCAADAMGGANIAIPDAVLRAIPAQLAPFRPAGQRFGEPVFDATLRRAGIRYKDLV